MPQFLQAEQRAACGEQCCVVQVLWVFHYPLSFRRQRRAHNAWALVVELHLWEALYNFPQAGFQSDHVLIQV